MRNDMKALQSALDAGDVAAAQESMSRIVQDNQDIAKAQKAQQDPSHQVLSGLPNVSSNDPAGQDEAADPQNTTGILLDVTA